MTQVQTVLACFPQQEGATSATAPQQRLLLLLLPRADHHRMPLLTVAFWNDPTWGKPKTGPPLMCPHAGNFGRSLQPLSVHTCAVTALISSQTLMSFLSEHLWNYKEALKLCINSNASQQVTQFSRARGTTASLVVLKGLEDSLTTNLPTGYSELHWQSQFRSHRL